MFTRKKRTAYPKPGPKMCHPRLGGSRKTCLPKDVLYRIGKSTKRNVVAKKLGCPEDSEICILDKSSLGAEEKARLEKSYFRPRKPEEWKKNPKTWLDNFNIKDVIIQFEEVWPDFHYLGTEPVDFLVKDPKNGSCISNNICKLDLAEERRKGKLRLGIVYNLDPSYEGGSHWVALFINLKTHNVYYFDSYGMEPPENIAYFMRYLSLLDPKMKPHYNGHRFQYGGSECGMYSIYFIWCMLKGIPFKKFIRMEVPDEVMQEFRDWMFAS